MNVYNDKDHDLLVFPDFWSARVGKTSLVARFLGTKFEESYTPTIEDFHRKLYRIRGEIYQLDLLDTSGNHPFPAMRRLSFLTGNVLSLSILFSYEKE
ncbi:unnamed protein product [Euphydryas editha]|uniref:Uncharacterized protein n=1 Tax=Euphydryas editha TaxID=104508 RepID=A0AAU9U0U8_EUPED|nr:unnamed protein product [Euphydryas editha]